MAQVSKICNGSQSAYYSFPSLSNHNKREHLSSSSSSSSSSSVSFRSKLKGSSSCWGLRHFQQLGNYSAIKATTPLRVSASVAAAEKPSTAPEIVLQPIKEISGTVKLPGSKSLSNRVLLLSALSEGRTVVDNLLSSDDIHYMLGALKTLGLHVEHNSELKQAIVEGCGGQFPAGIESKNVELFLGNAGTAMRPLTAAVTVAGGNSSYILDGVPRMRERPIGDLVVGLKQLGADIACSATNCPPVHVKGKGGLPGGKVKLSGSISSQYLTALLMAAPLALGDVEVEIIDKLISIPYVEMTLKLMERFGVTVDHNSSWDRFFVRGGQKYKSPGSAYVEGDASSASYFLAGAAITGGTISVEGCGTSSLQGDVRFAEPKFRHWSSSLSQLHKDSLRLDKKPNRKTMEDSARPATGYPIPNGRHSPHPQQPSSGTAYPYQAPPSGSAYPYQAPPFVSGYPQYQAAPPANQPYYYNRRTLLSRRVFLIFVFCAAIAFSVLFFIWLFLRPHLPEFRVTSLTVSNFNISTSQTLTGVWDAKFQVYNPNKKTKISYHAVESRILYDSETLSHTRIPPFSQDTKAVTVVNASYSADTFVDEWVVAGINGGRIHGLVLFNLQLVGEVAYKSRGLWLRRHLIRVFCKDVAVGLPENSNSGNFTGGGGRGCRIH